MRGDRQLRLRLGLRCYALAWRGVVALGVVLCASVYAALPTDRHPGHEERTVGCVRCHTDPNETPRVAMDAPQCAACHAVDAPLVKAALRQAEPAAAESITRQELVLIPAGEFQMGNNGRTAIDGPGNKDETPLHTVRLEAYYIDRYETTNAMYQEFVRATGHRTPKHWKDGRYPSGKANHPVVYVSWHDALAFCTWAGKRLPSEAEWEKAARGDDGRIFPWGNSFDGRKANTPQYWLQTGAKPDSEGYVGGTLPVGSFEAGKSVYGLYDMAGNVYEWVDDWYLPYPGNEYPNAKYGYSNKILRGGSWYDCLTYGCGMSAPTYNRSRLNPDIRNMGFGFRCAKAAESSGVKRAGVTKSEGTKKP